MIPFLLTQSNLSHFQKLFPQETMIPGKVIWIGHYYCRFTKPGQKLPKLNQNIGR
jgi:hypothetical protein